MSFGFMFDWPTSVEFFARPIMLFVFQKISYRHYKMFESGILAKLDLYCQYHPKNRVTSICVDNQCLNSPLLCPHCLSEFDHKGKHLYHDGNIKNLWDGVSDLSTLVEKDRPVMDKLFKQIAGKKENQELIRWQEEYERHAGSFENHINSIKYQIDQQVKTMSRVFQTALEQAKQQAFKQLDRYYRTYRENFDIFSRLIEPLIAFNTNHKYYSNFNNIAFKLFTQSKKKSSEWLIELKNTLTFTQKISANPSSFEQIVERATTYMNAMIDSLPTTEYNEQKTLASLRHMTSQILKNSLQICDLKSLNLILSTVSHAPTNQTHNSNQQPFAAVNDQRRSNGGKKIFDEKAMLARKSSR